MAKQASSERISISKIYDTIKARNFLQELWWDLISDISNKPTYQRIKEMVKCAINGTVNEIIIEPITEEERVKKRTMLTEISIMTYTVDTVISEVLHKKLQNEYPSLIEKMIEGLIKEKENQDNINMRNNTNILTTTANKPNTNNAEGPLKVISPKNKSPYKTLNSDEGTNNLSPKKRGRPKKQSPGPKILPIADGTISQKKRGRPSIGSGKSISSTPVTKKSSSNASPSSFGNRKRNHDDAMPENEEGFGKESGDESMGSGKFSFGDVSSVHTSELSSFEDVISVSSSDEGDRPKRFVDLKYANDMYLKGKLSEIYKIKEKAEKLKKTGTLTHPARKNTSPKSKESTKTPISCKKLPQRIRKPNSKYNSKIMYCGIKGRSPQARVSASPSKTAIPAQSPEKKKKQRLSLNNEKLLNSAPDNSSIVSRSTDNSITKIHKNSSPTKTPMTLRHLTLQKQLESRNSAVMNHSPLDKSSTKRYHPSDLYKPRNVIGNAFGSRGGTTASPFLS